MEMIEANKPEKKKADNKMNSAPPPPPKKKNSVLTVALRLPLYSS